MDGWCLWVPPVDFLQTCLSPLLVIVIEILTLFTLIVSCAETDHREHCAQNENY